MAAIKLDEMGTIKLSNEDSVAVTDVAIAIHCLICNESVLLDDFEIARLDYGGDIAPKICDKCKRAVMQMRKETDNMDKYW